MGMDYYRRGRRAFPRAVVKTGATNIDNGEIRIPLPKVWLVSEHTVRVRISQGFAVAPSSTDPRRAFEAMRLEVDKGRGKKLNFHAAYDLGRFTENAPSPVESLGTTSTLDFTFEVHHENDKALGGLGSALLTGKYSTLDLVLKCASKADNCFIGGTTPGEASYTVEVLPQEERDMTPAVRNDEHSGWGKIDHAEMQQASVTGTQSGLDDKLPLTAGGKVRFVSMHFFNAATGGSLTDLPITLGGEISLTVNGFEYFNKTPLSAIKQHNIRHRCDLGTGAVVLDFGDDPRAWLDLRDVKEPKFDLYIPASGSLPAAWRLEYAQDATYGLENLSGNLAA